MWLPEPIYKALPAAYAFIGVAFVLGVLYVGPDHPLNPVYLGFGIVSVFAAGTVTYWRAKYKGERSKVDSDEPQTD